MAYAANLGRDNIIYPGLIAAWSAKGKTNDDADRATLKDLTGNGHDITLNNFAYSGMSGYGGYNTYFLKTKDNTITANIQKNKLNVTNVTGNGRFAYNWANGFSGIIYSSYKIQVKGLKDTMNLVYVYYNEKKEKKEVNLTEDGIYQIPDGYGIKETGFVDFFGFYISNFTGECNLIIELIPKYPDALVFDGVDDYGSAVDFGDTTYVQTIIIKYLAMSSSPYKSYSYIRGDNSSGYFRMNNKKNIDEEPFIRAAVLPHNIYIKKDTDFFEKSNWDTNKYEPYNINGYSKGREIGKMAFYSAYLFDRSLDEQEIKAFIRKHIDSEYLLPSEIPTPPSQQGELKYWLCGEDAPVNNKWVDRIDNRMQWELVGSSVYNQEGKYYELGELIGKQAIFNDTNNIFNCGDTFEIEIDFELLPVPDNITNKCFILDIGSVSQTNKNFGIAALNNKIIVNYKMFGDSAVDEYGISPSQLNNTTIVKEGRQTIYMGVEKYSDTQNIVYVKDSFGNKVYAPNPHTSINHSNFIITTYVIGAGLTPGYSFNTVKIYNIKVYVKSYKETMNFIIIPLADAAEVFTSDELKAARKSIDGKEVLVHEEILLQKKIERGLMTLPTDGEPVVWTYPVYAYNSKELDALLDSDKWTSKEELMTVVSDNRVYS